MNLKNLETFETKKLLLIAILPFMFEFKDFEKCQELIEDVYENNFPFDQNPNLFTGGANFIIDRYGNVHNFPKTTLSYLGEFFWRISVSPDYSDEYPRVRHEAFSLKIKGVGDINKIPSKEMEKLKNNYSNCDVYSEIIAVNITLFHPDICKKFVLFLFGKGYDTYGEPLSEIEWKDITIENT